MPEKHFFPVAAGNVLANCMAFLTMYSTLTLFHIYRVAGKVPMKDGMTVPEKIETFLPGWF